jgi:hypothetical protein
MNEGCCGPIQALFLPEGAEEDHETPQANPSPEYN